jgi:hypothetical protein
MTSRSVDDTSQQELSGDRSQEKPSNRLEGFDFLRAIFSIAIVALKTNLFALAEILGSGVIAYGLMSKIGYLAVPVFFQISLFLFYVKSKQSGFSYFLQKRLPKLISLYLFWLISKVLFDIFANGQLETIKQRLSSFRQAIEFIVSGNQSPFFFFFSLIFLSTLAAMLTTLLKRLEKPYMNVPISYGLLFLSCLLVFSFSLTLLLVNPSSGNSEPGFLRAISSIASWDYNPISFLPYIFTAFIATQEFNEGKLKSLTLSLKLKLCGLLFLYVMFSVLEWNLFEKLLHYSRLSLIFGSWLLLYLGILSTRKVPGIVKFISTCSLGIYGFHVFFTRVPALEQTNFIKNFLQTVPGLEILTGFLVTLIGSIALTLVFRKIRFLKNFV